MKPRANHLRVGIDVSNAVDPRPTGVARYIRRLIESLGALPDAPELRLYCRPSRLRRGHPRELFPDQPVHWLVGAPLFGGIDVFHAPDLRLPTWCPAPMVVTVHDLSAYQRRDHATAHFIARKQKQIRHASRAARTIITHSDSVRDELIETLQVEEDRVVAVPLADGLPPVEVTSDVAREDFLLLVGGPSRRKGSHRLKPLLELWRNHLDWTPPLRWVGSAPRDDAREFLDGPVEFLGHVADEELSRLYHRALGLLHLSDTEGFGLPLLEAAGRRCPVLSIDAPVLREVLGEEAFWFQEPLESSLTAFQEFRDAARRQEIAERAARRATGFRWERTAEATLAAYGRALPARDS